MLPKKSIKPISIVVLFCVCTISLIFSPPAEARWQFVKFSWKLIWVIISVPNPEAPLWWVMDIRIRKVPQPPGRRTMVAIAIPNDFSVNIPGSGFLTRGNRRLFLTHSPELSEQLNIEQPIKGSSWFAFIDEALLLDSLPVGSEVEIFFQVEPPDPAPLIVRLSGAFGEDPDTGFDDFVLDSPTQCFQARAQVNAVPCQGKEGNSGDKK